MPAHEGPALSSTGASGHQRSVQRAPIATQIGRDRAEPGGARVYGAGGIETAGQCDLGRRQGAGLVGAQHRHRPEIMDRG